MKHIHRTLLKPCVGGGEPSTGTSQSDQRVEMSPSVEEDHYDGDWFVLVPEAPRPHLALPAVPLPAGNPQHSSGQPDSILAEPANSEGSSTGPIVLDREPSASQLDEPRAVRRTLRSTAGQHSNFYHLPQAVGAASASNAVSALFRPWN